MYLLFVFLMVPYRCNGLYYIEVFTFVNEVEKLQSHYLGSPNDNVSELEEGRQK